MNILFKTFSSHFDGIFNRYIEKLADKYDIDKQELLDEWNTTCKEENKNFGKRKKKNKGPSRTTGFLLFCAEHRPKIKEDTPDISFPDIGRKLGEMWRGLKDKEKAKYNTKAKEENAKNL